MSLTEHDEVWRISMHVILSKATVENLGVTTTTVDILFVFYCELEDQGLFFATEWLELRRKGIEPGILRCLNACQK